MRINSASQKDIRTVDVPLGEDSYTISIGGGLMRDAQLLAGLITTRQVCVVTNQVIADLYRSVVMDCLRSIDTAMEIQTVILPEGETHKNQHAINTIHDCLIENRFARDCMIVALGGGIVGDIAGFAAASYQRGVRFIQMPTTVLAQVDSSVGGKTGVNHRLGKNLIGAFHQPQAVIIDTDVLESLPSREISAGMAEVIKYGLIRDSAFLQNLDESIEHAIALDSEYVSELIQISCQHKADVVEADEKERGDRATLNLGHTFGHAVEALTHYNTYLHGEAVAIGAMMALELSVLLGLLSQDELLLAERLFERAGCPISMKSCAIQLSPSEIRAAMQRDKKVSAGKLTLILLDGLGKAIIRKDVDEGLILQAIEKRL